jgi:hypothetical protein
MTQRLLAGVDDAHAEVALRALDAVRRNAGIQLA